jgi:tetratricopeptide (TPR) repeat protein
MASGPTPSSRRPARPSRLDRAGLEFLAGFLQSATERYPENVAALADLGHALTRLGRYEEGLEVDLRLVALDPENPVAHYNLACSLCLLERTDEALAALEDSVRGGYDDVEHLLEDEDLVPLAGDPRFQALVKRLRGASAEQA